MLTHTKNRKSYTLKALLCDYKVKAELKAPLLSKSSLGITH